MKLNKNKKIISLICLLLMTIGVLTLNVGSAAASFGISPPYVKNDKLTRGTHFEQPITIIAGGLTKSMPVQVVINVPEANQWISIDKGLQFTIPSNTKTYPIVVSVDVPQNAAYKEYKGSIEINTVPDPLTGTAGVALAVEASVDLTVTEQKISNFSIGTVSVISAEEGGDLTTLINVKNLGNIPVAPSKVTMEVYNDKVSADAIEDQDFDKSNLIATKENLEISDKVEPFVSGNIKVRFDIGDLPKGTYIARFTVYNDATLVKKTGAVSFDILAKGAGSQGATTSPLASALGLITQNKVVMYLLLAALVLIIILIIIRSSGKNKKRSKK